MPIDLYLEKPRLGFRRKGGLSPTTYAFHVTQALRMLSVAFSGWYVLNFPVPREVGFDTLLG